MKPEDAAWLAGLLEGEGCFRRTNHTPIIQLSMTDQDVTARAANLMKVPTYGPYSKGNGRKDQWMACAAGEKAMATMRTIRRYMGERRGQRIDEILAWTSTRPGSGTWKRTAALLKQAIV